MVALIRSTGANYASVRFALRRLGVDVVATEDEAVIRNASHVILPGVGSARTGMAKLRAAGLDAVVPELTQPVLGICLGMQVMFERSEEGDTECLGIFKGTIRRMPSTTASPVPHMGWNVVEPTAGRTPAATLTAAPPNPGWAYFVHSYAAPVGADTVATTTYSDTFASIVARSNFMGVQFHPERSADFGSRLLASFLEGS